MLGVFKKGDRVSTESGLECAVDAFLGGGGQGEVYRATLGSGSIALKWYYSASATDAQRKGLAILIGKGRPDERFLWPMELVKSADRSRKGQFGYLMELRPDRFKSINDLLGRRVSPTLRSLVTAGVNLADAFRNLHGLGLCYRDISQGNVFFDPGDGEIRICDNDNVGIEDSPSGVVGTLQYMAPEVITRKARPSTQTDLHSLAVLLFLMLFNHHPLHGRKELGIDCFSPEAAAKLYGDNPVFIFDQNDTSNAAVPGEHDNARQFWSIYPGFLKDRFTEAFTVGLKDPGRRVRESTWVKTLNQLRDAILYCRCGAENFYDPVVVRAGAATRCWNGVSCGQTVQLPPRIRLAQDVVVMLNHDSVLYPHHVDPAAAVSFATPVAEVSQHPANPSVWGLRNLTGQPWSSIGSDGSTRQVDPGRSVALARGTRIQFGRVEGEIRS